MFFQPIIVTGKQNTFMLLKAGPYNCMSNDLNSEIEQWNALHSTTHDTIVDDALKGSLIMDRYLSNSFNTMNAIRHIKPSIDTVIVGLYTCYLCYSSSYIVQYDCDSIIHFVQWNASKTMIIKHCFYHYCCMKTSTSAVKVAILIF